MCLNVDYYRSTDISNFMTYSVDYYEGMKEINLSNTNINLDFSKLYDVYGYGLEKPFVSIEGVNFENVDLSKCDTSKIRQLVDVNLLGTNIKFTSRTEEPFLNFCNVNLTNIDLSKFNIGRKNFCLDLYWDYGYDYKKYHCDVFWNCNLKNTKININEYDIEFFLGSDERRMRKEYNEQAQENFYSMLNEGKLEGCYLNGKLLKPFIKRTEEERKINKERILAEYAEFEKKTFDEIIGNVAKEVKKSRK